MQCGDNGGCEGRAAGERAEEGGGDGDGAGAEAEEDGVGEEGAGGCGGGGCEGEGAAEGVDGGGCDAETGGACCVEDVGGEHGCEAEGEDRDEGEGLGCGFGEGFGGGDVEWEESRAVPLTKLNRQPRESCVFEMHADYGGLCNEDREERDAEGEEEDDGHGLWDARADAQRLNESESGCTTRMTRVTQENPSLTKAMEPYLRVFIID